MLRLVPSGLAVLVAASLAFAEAPSGGTCGDGASQFSQEELVLMPKPLTITMLALLVGVSVHAQARSGRPVVIVDRSHEWLLGYMTLKDEVLIPGGLDVTVRDCSLAAGPALTEGDMLFVGQVGTASVPFSPSERELLMKYVSEGGVLFLYGEAQQPIAAVASCFGFGFVEKRVALPFVTGPDLRRLGAPDSVPAAQREVPYAITAPPTARGLLFGQGGEPLAAELTWGRGRVICMSARSWDMGAGDPVQRQAVRASTLALFRVCLGARQPLPGAGATVQIKAENLVELPELPGWLIDYPSTIEADAKSLIALMPQMARAVQRYNGAAAGVGEFSFGIIATDAGGVTGGSWACVQAKGQLGDNIAVAAHEYTHTLICGLPPILNEGWASEVANRVRLELGYPDEAQRKALLLPADYREPDVIGNTVDVSQEPADSPPGLYARKARLMWMVRELERRYGSDFMLRFLDLHRALDGSSGISVSRALYYFSLVAGEDLTPWYKSLGVNPQPVESVSPAEIEAKLAAYRTAQAQLAEDIRCLNQYRADPTPFRSDAWRAEWRIERGLYGKGAARPEGWGNDECWVEDLRFPPAAVPWAKRADAGERRGFLIFHAPEPKQVGVLACDRIIPQAGRTTLLLGFARRDGQCTVLRVLANGAPVWERELARDGWFHVPIPLDAFRGKRVRLELQTDTRGKWDAKEVYLDYLIVQTQP